MLMEGLLRRDLKPCKEGVERIGFCRSFVHALAHNKYLLFCEDAVVDWYMVKWCLPLSLIDEAAFKQRRSGFSWSNPRDEGMLLPYRICRCVLMYAMMTCFGLCVLFRYLCLELELVRLKHVHVCTLCTSQARSEESKFVDRRKESRNRHLIADMATNSAEHTIVQYPVQHNVSASL